MKKLLYIITLLSCLNMTGTIVFAETPPVQSWVAQYGGLSNKEFATASKVVIDTLGNVYVTGTTYETGPSDYITIKYDAYGKQLWVKRYDSGGYDRAVAISVDILGDVYVTGSGGEPWSTDYITVKYDTNGKQLWVRRYDGNSSIDSPATLLIDNQKNIYVTGYSHNYTTKHNNYSTVKYDTNGVQLWAVQYDSGNDSNAVALSLDTIGNVYIAGKSHNGTNYDYLTVKYDTNGKQLWVKRYDSGGSDGLGAIAVDAVGNVYVAGHSYDIVTGYYYAIVKYDTNGKQLWVKGNNIGPVDSWNSTPSRLFFVDSLGNIYVAGTGGTGRGNYVVTKYDSSGNNLWVAENSGVGKDYATALVVDVAGNSYITGQSHNGTNYDYRTVKYDTYGAKLWEVQYDGGSGEIPNAISVDNFGNIVVTGYGWEGYYTKYVTVKHILSNNNFLSVVKNAPNSLELRKTPGIKITETQMDKPSNDIIKTVPNDWVLKVATTTDSAGKPFEIDDYRWYGVIDETDNADGWIAAKDLTTGTEYLSYDASAQASLGAKASSTLYATKETRIPVILQAVDTYYTQPNTLDSLYGGGGGSGGKNNFQRFIQGSTFPKELVLAIISQESVSIKFDNEGCSSILDGGIGIMQITSLDARGSGSNLKNYPKMGDCMAVSTSKYYSNAWQGIFANIKDGFRTLQDKFGYVRKTEAVDNITAQEMKAISTVYRYNQGSPYKVQAVYEIWNGQSDDYVWNEYLKYIYLNRIRTTTADSWMQKVRDVCSSEATFNGCLAKTEITKFVETTLTTSAFYLRDVGNKLHSSPFGSSYQNPTYGDKLIAANNSRLVLFLRSPAELRVVNSAGEITGSVAGEPMEEIANSVYVPEQKFVTIFFPRAQYKYRVVGLETGEYGLSADFINNGDHTFFDADYIPTHAGEIHDYTIDWDKMSRCERGSVLLEVDYEGDGIVDRVVKGSCRLSDINPPAITISSPSGSYLLNATTTIQFTVTDASGIETISATLNGVTVSNNQVILFTKPGENIIEVSAMDTEGNTSTVTTAFNVLYTVNGFLQPVRLDGSGVYNQGMTLPVRFEARDVNGKVVPSVSTQLYIVKVIGGVVSGDEIPTSTTASSTGNQFRYDAGGHMYIFNLSTGSMSPGTWQIKAVLDSGQEIKADVQIKSK